GRGRPARSFSSAIRLRLSRTSLLPFLQDSFPNNFLECGKTRSGLGQATPAKREHSLIDRFLLELQRRRAHQNQFAQFVVDLHDLIKTDAALVAGLIAGATSLAYGDFRGRRFLLA